MTFLTFDSTNISDPYTIHFPGFEIIMEFFIDAVKFIAGTVIIIEIHFCLTVTINTPAHV